MILPVIFCLAIFALLILSFNYQNSQKRTAEQQNIANIKKGQEAVDNTFYQSQTNKAATTKALQEQTSREQAAVINAQQQAIEQGKAVEEARMQQDQDGDGLTYAQELNLGTSDNNKDSDYDGVPDNEDAHPAGGGENYKITVSWQHKGYPYTTQFGIPSDRYSWYRNKARHYHNGEYATYLDPAIQSIAEDITDNARSQGESCLYCAAIDFVESMVYQYDIDYNGIDDYPKYAIETIVDQRGDCEDTSYLMGAILRALNIDTVLLLYSDHMAVGIACDGCTGTYYNHRGKRFFFLETTGDPNSWELGGIWGKYGSETPQIIEIA